MVHNILGENKQLSDIPESKYYYYYNLIETIIIFHIKITEKIDEKSLFEHWSSIMMSEIIS